MATRARIFRISEIPQHWSGAKVRQAMNHYGVEILSTALRLLPSCVNADKFTTTAAIDSTASALEKIIKNPLQSDIFPYEDGNLVVDQHFSGLTTLAAPDTDSSTTADVIAIHGLSGHAFGSWATFVERKEEYVCWLSDFLAQDVPNVRVLTYGYESRLDKTTTVSRLVDYRRAFLRDISSYLELGREPGRPLILMGHSFGGTVIAQALQTAKLQVEKPAMADFLKSAIGIFFFGVPHGGLRTTELQNMTRERAEDSKTKLLVDLEKDSETLRQLSEFLTSLCLDVQFVSCYEEAETPTPIKKPDGGWSRTGKSVMMVDERSALLRVPNEIQIPTTGNHNTMIKFSHRDSNYAAIRNHVLEIISKSSSRRRDGRGSLNQRIFDLVVEQRAKSQRSTVSEPDLFGLAFGLSGAVNRANKFLDEFRTVIAAYWETPDTHKQFGIFRFQCWMFVSWLETLKASWQSSCTSNIGRSDALAPAVSVLGGVLADIIRRAVDTMADAVKFKQTYGSFEMADLQNLDGQAAEARLADLTRNFKACIDQLPNLIAPGRAWSLLSQASAATLATLDDPEMLRKLDDADIGLPEPLLESARMKLELRQARVSAAASSSLWKPLECIVASKLGRSTSAAKSLVLATYSENRAKASVMAAVGTSSGLVRAHPDDARRVLVEWTVISRQWKLLHVELCRSRIEKLVRQLGIRSKPATVRVLRAVALVEDFRDERNKRLGIIYELPPGISTAVSPVSLQDLLPVNAEGLSPLGEPLLSARFRLAYVLATALHELHRVGWLHKELSSANIVFLLPTARPLPSSETHQPPSPDLAQPYITGFGYARPDTEKVISVPTGGALDPNDLFRHPSVRRPHSAPEQEGQAIPRFRRRFDVYSFGLILLEIGLWDRIATFERASDRDDPHAFAARLRRIAAQHLGHRMGAAYRDVVIGCLGTSETDRLGLPAVDDEDAEEELMAFYFGVVKQLGGCQCGLQTAH